MFQKSSLFLYKSWFSTISLYICQNIHFPNICIYIYICSILSYFFYFNFYCFSLFKPLLWKIRPCCLLILQIVYDETFNCPRNDLILFIVCDMSYKFVIQINLSYKISTHAHCVGYPYLLRSSSWSFAKQFSRLVLGYVVGCVVVCGGECGQLHLRRTQVCPPAL